MRQKSLAPASGKKKKRNFRSLSPKTTVKSSHAQQPRRGAGPPCKHRPWLCKLRVWAHGKSDTSSDQWSHERFGAGLHFCATAGGFQRPLSLAPRNVSLTNYVRPWQKSKHSADNFLTTPTMQQSFPILLQEHVTDSFLQHLTPPSTIPCCLKAEERELTPAPSVH